MGQVGDLIGAKGAAAAGMLGPAEHPGLKERAIDDQLRAALEQVEQANLTPRPFELVLLLHRHPRHPSTLGCQRITGAGQSLLLLEELLPGSLPLLLRHDRRRLHCEIPFLLFLVSLYACCHLYLLSGVVLRSSLFDYQTPFSFAFFFSLVVRLDVTQPSQHSPVRKLRTGVLAPWLRRCVSPRRWIGT